MRNPIINTLAAIALLEVATPAAWAQEMCDYAHIDCSTGKVLSSELPTYPPDLSGHQIWCRGDALYCGSTGTAVTIATGTKTGSATSSNTATGTSTASATGTGQRTDGATYAQTASKTGTGTSTVTLIADETGTITATVSATKTITVTGSVSYTGTASASGSGTGTGTVSGTASWSASATASGTATATHTESWTASGTQTITWDVGHVTQTLTFTALGTRTGSGSATGTVTATASATGTGTSTMTGTWNNTSTVTNQTTDATIDITTDNPIVMTVNSSTANICNGSGFCSSPHLAEFYNGTSLTNGPTYSATSSANAIAQMDGSGTVNSLVNGRMLNWQMLTGPLSPQTVNAAAGEVLLTRYAYLYWPLSRVVINATANVVAFSGGASDKCYLYLKLDGSGVGITSYVNTPSVSGQYLTMATNAAADLTAGSHTIDLIALADGSIACDFDTSHASMVISIFTQ